MGVGGYVLFGSGFVRFSGLGLLLRFGWLGGFRVWC